MEAQPYTVGRWLVKPGRETAFIAAWKELGTFFLSLPQPPGLGTLVQSADEPRLFYSFGSWNRMEDIAAMRSDPRTPGMIRKLAELCEEAQPGNYRLVATAGP